MTLQNRKRQGQVQGNSNTPASERDRKTQQTAATFPVGIHAQVDAEPVRIIAVGDIPGYSPAFLCVDNDRDAQWVAMDEVKIVDPNFLPIQLPQDR